MYECSRTDADHAKILALGDALNLLAVQWASDLSQKAISYVPPINLLAAFDAAACPSP
jgi:hypothetical protein